MTNRSELRLTDPDEIALVLAERARRRALEAHPDSVEAIVETMSLVSRISLLGGHLYLASTPENDFVVIRSSSARDTDHESARGAHYSLIARGGFREVIETANEYLANLARRSGALTTQRFGLTSVVNS